MAPSLPPPDDPAAPPVTPPSPAGRPPATGPSATGPSAKGPSPEGTSSAADSLEARFAELPRLDPRELQPPPPRRRVGLPLFLFLATCASTFFVGATGFEPLRYLESADVALRAIFRGWEQGLMYMGAVLAILLTHEMGHFLTTLRYGIPATYPLFIPVPINAIGTMGAVIAMDGLKANRREMFDLGLSGPLAGLLVALPVLVLGVNRLDVTSGPPTGLAFYNPLLVEWMIGWLRPDIADPTQPIGLYQLNPYFMAGWVGLLITGLNMLPISQLDGGHVTYALFGRRAHVVARTFLMVSIGLVVLYIDHLVIWVPMLVLVTLLGTDHPPTSDDSARLGPLRWTIGLASLAIPVLCFPVWGIRI